MASVVTVDISCDVESTCCMLHFNGLSNYKKIDSAARVDLRELRCYAPMLRGDALGSGRTVQFKRDARREAGGWVDTQTTS